MGGRSPVPQEYYNRKPHRMQIKEEIVMDLKQGAITVKEILANPKAKELMQKYFPQVADNKLLMTMAKGWTLNQVIAHVGDKVDNKTKEKIRKELEGL